MQAVISLLMLAYSGSVNWSRYLLIALQPQRGLDFAQSFDGSLSAKPFGQIVNLTAKQLDL